MNITLPVAKKFGESNSMQMSDAVNDRALACVHCGLCLPACPTYLETGNEAESPRGRIQIMRGLSEGTLQLTDETQLHLDSCLDCRGCETACPSGVIYHEIIQETRQRLQLQPGFVQSNRLMRWMFLNILTNPMRLKLALVPMRLMQKIGLMSIVKKVSSMLPDSWNKLIQMLPATGRIWPGKITVPDGMEFKRLRTSSDKKKIKVAFFGGCIGSVMFQSTNQKAVDLLVKAGAEVIIPDQFGCCGAIHHHAGCTEDAIAMAKRNITDMQLDVDYIVTNIAGCGAMLREYDHLLNSDQAKIFAGKVADISEVLLKLGLPEMKHAVNETVTYHEACHLVHAQKVSAAPKQILNAIPGLKVVPLPEADTCCGAAGTYNLTQPVMAKQLARRKLENIQSTQSKYCAAGNVGCSLHIQSEADARKMDLQVVHTIELLHRAVFGETNLKG